VTPRAAWLVVLVAACGAQGDDGDDTTTPPSREDFASFRYDDAPPPADASNRYGDDPAAAVLGQRLFFEKRFSGPLMDPDNGALAGTLGPNGTPGLVSCASCHVPADGFVDTRSPGQQISIGAQWTPRKSPGLLESGFITLFNWGGERDSMWRQTVGVIESNREFNSSRLYVAQRVFELYRADYEALFGAMPPLDDTARFPALAAADAGCIHDPDAPTAEYICHGLPGDGAEYDGMDPQDQTAVTRVAVNVAKAIAAYQRLLRCGESRFDAWLDGDDAALADAELRGAALFIGKADCASCHTGPNFTDNEFHNVGLAPKLVAQAFIDENDHGAEIGLAGLAADPLNVQSEFSDGDDGRLPTSIPESMAGAFRTPSLRCNAGHPSFMHTAQLRTVADVVEFFNQGGDPPGPYPGVSEIQPLGLTEDEQADLTAFLAALDGPGPDAALLVDPN
jgi:cytochrome c peroxidase